MCKHYRLFIRGVTFEHWQQCRMFFPFLFFTFHSGCVAYNAIALITYI